MRNSSIKASASTSPNATLSLRIRTALEADDLAFLEEGGRMLLFWTDPEPEMKPKFATISAGRPTGDYGTVIADHPLFARFPHDGYCDWQFFSLLNHATPAIFLEPDLPFDPILEVIAPYKRIRRKAHLYEYAIGKGRILLCSLSPDPADPASVFFLNELFAYLDGPDFAPPHRINAEQLIRHLASAAAPKTNYTPDVALDPTALHARQEADQ